LLPTRRPQRLTSIGERGGRTTRNPMSRLLRTADAGGRNCAFCRSVRHPDTQMRSMYPLSLVCPRRRRAKCKARHTLDDPLTSTNKWGGRATALARIGMLVEVAIEERGLGGDQPRDLPAGGTSRRLLRRRNALRCHAVRIHSRCKWSSHPGRSWRRCLCTSELSARFVSRVGGGARYCRWTRDFIEKLDRFRPSTANV
jgi:hypothetical protein